MRRELTSLACVAVPLIGLLSSSAHAALLVDFNSGSETNAVPSDFSTALGLSSGPTYDDINQMSSAVTEINIGLNGTPGPITSGSMTIISSNGSFSYGGQLSTPLFDQTFTQNSPSTYTDLISGVPLLANQNYSLYIFIDNVFGGTTDLDLSYGLGTPVTTTGLGTGDFAELDFNSGAVPTGDFTLIFTGTGGTYTGFGAFAVVADASATTPEPATLSLLTVGAIGMLSRRRRRVL